MQKYMRSNYSQGRNYYKKPFYKTLKFYFFLILIGAIVFFVFWSIKKTDQVDNSQQKFTDQEMVPSMTAKVKYSEGLVELKTEEDGWQEVAENYQVQAGDIVRTNEDSKTTIELPDESLVRLAANSEIKFEQLGMADINIQQLSGNSFHRVHSKSTAIYRVKNNNTELTSLGTAFNVYSTANLTKLTVTEGKVKIKIYDDQENIINMRTIDTGSQATINPDLETEKMIAVDDVDASDLLANDWYAWNLEEDREGEFYLGLFEKAIKLSLSQPEKDPYETDEDKLTIKGETDPEADIFVAGKELDNNNGSFETEIALQPGENEIEITVKKGKNTNKKTLNIISTKQNETIKLTQSTTDNNVSLSWEIENIENFKEFKILQSQEANPTYPDSLFHTASAETFSDNWNNLANSTYYFRVCALDNENKCLIYSNTLTITIGDQEETPTGTLSLSLDKSNNNINLSWTVSNDTEVNEGFKTIISQSENPTYPGNSYHSLNVNQRDDTWRRLSAGTYHFRVCVTKNGQCILYSNNVSTSITETDLGSISLSGSNEAGKINLSWTIDNIDTPKGLRVMMSETPSIAYPGQSHHLVIGSGQTTDSWELDTGKTYYFSVCQNMGSDCGTYSNEIEISN